MKKKVLSLFVTFAMLFSMLPATALAAGETVAYIGDTSYASLQEAINAASVTGETTIALVDGNIDGDVNITIAAVGEQKGNIKIVAKDGATPVITGTVTLGLYQKGTTNVAKWNSAVTFDGITFDHAESEKHSIDVQSVGGLTLNKCTIVGDGEYGIGSASGGNSDPSTISNCTFTNAGMQVTGNFGTGLVIDNCTFNDSCINVQGGNGVTVKNSTFNATVTDAHVGESFYAIRSNDIAITVEDTKFNIDSTVTGIATEQAKWGVLWQRQAGGTKWTVKDIEVNYTDAAMAQAELLLNKNGTTTEANKADRVTITGLTSNKNDVAELISKSEGHLIAEGQTYLGGELDFTGKVAKIGSKGFETVAAALADAKDGDIVTLISGGNAISMAGSVVGGKTVTITGTAVVDWTQGNLFIGRGGEGNGKVIFDGANITSSVKKNPASTGIHVSGGKKTDANINYGTLEIKNSNIELDYLINRNETVVGGNSTLTVYGGCWTHGRDANESTSGTDETATLTIGAGSTVNVINENGMGVGGEGKGVMTVNGAYNANVLNVKGIVNIGGAVKIDGAVNNSGSIVLTAADATLTSGSEAQNVTSDVADYKVVYDNGVHKLAAEYVAKIGNVGYSTFEKALDAVQDGGTITLMDAEGDESGNEIDFTKDISFTITGEAPDYALPVVTFQNATVNIENAVIKTAELDARQNATINVVNSTVYSAGGDPIVKSYYNGAINISGTSKVYTHQLTTMGYITISDTAEIHVTWQTNVYGNGMLTVEDTAVFDTAALHLTGKDYSGRDNTDADRLGKPAAFIVDGATVNVGKVLASNGADYSYLSSEGINVGTVSGKKAELNVVNGGKVNIYMANGETANIGADGTVNIDNSFFGVSCRAENGTVTLVNNGTINVSGASDIAAPVTGSGWVYMNGVTLDADTKLTGAKVRFASGTNSINGATIDDGFFQVGIGAYKGVDAKVDTDNGVIVNVKNAKIGSSGSTYAGWIGTGFYDTDAEKAAAMTNAKYVLNIENSVAEFGYLHISNDGELNVKGNAAEKATYNNSDYSFYAGDFIVNGTANFDATDVLALYTKVSCDNGTDKPGTVNIKNGTYYEAERHNGAVDGTNFTLYKTGVVNVEKGAELYIGEYTSIAADAKMNIGGTATALGAITNNGTITLTDAAATLTTTKVADAQKPESGVKYYYVTYANNAYKLVTDYVAEVNGTPYTTLAAAVDVGGEVKLLTDVTENVTIPDGATLTIDLNQKTLNGYVAPCTPASLTIKNGSIVNNESSKSAIEVNAGSLTLTDVNVSSARHAVRIDGAVTATIDGGNYTLIATSGSTQHAVNVSGDAAVTIKDGTFVGPKRTTMDSGAAVNVQAGSAVNIEGGNFTNGKNDTLASKGTLTITGGTFDQDPSAYVAEGYEAVEDSGVWTVQRKTYTITFDVNGGNDSNSTSTTKSDGTVTLPSDPTRSGYTFKGWYTASSGGTKVTASTVFTADTTVYAQWTQNYSGGGGGSYTPGYSITAEDTENGSISLSPKSASSGTTVTITVDPDKGYVLGTLTVLDKNGKEIELTKKADNKYTFKMPSGKVTVEATFMEDNTMLNYFVDVFASDYYYDAVLWAVENGITNGTSATTFSPTDPCTRAQMATFLWRAAGSPEPAGSTNPFVDVPTDAYYAKAVQWAYEQGITGGTSATTFSPDETCTRGQMATFLWRDAGSSAVSGEGAPFVDVPADGYYATAVDWAYEEGITGGTSATTYSPNDPCTRGQMVTFLYRYLAE